FSLQLGAATGDERGVTLPRIRFFVGDRSRFGIMCEDRHLENNAAAWRNRQKWGIGLCALLTQRGQHDRHQFVEVREHLQKSGIEAARRITICGGKKFVLETELVEEGSQSRVVGGGEGGMFVRERIRDAGKRFAEV